MATQHINPSTLHNNPGFTQVVVTAPNTTTIYIGGQNSVDADGNIVGKGDLAAQTAQAPKNIQHALTAVSAELEHIIKWNVLVVHGENGHEGFAEFSKIWGDRPNPPAITMAYVSALAVPDFLVEIDVVAALPAD